MSENAVTDPVQLTNPADGPTESKSARKKRAKAEAASKNTTEPNTNGQDASETAQELDANDEASSESPYIKELQKNIRNVTKKLNAMQKLDQILIENPNTSLDDLVASRKINNDQKAQALKKPALQASLTQLEEQIAQYKKVDAEYQARMASERESLTSSHKAEVESLKEQLKKDAEAESKGTLRKKLLVFSQFLRAAAAKRVIEEEADTEESKAFEGALLLVYGGDDKAVDAAVNLIEGADEAVPSVEGTLLSVKYSQIKQASVEHAPYQQEEGWVESVPEPTTSTEPAPEATDAPPATDPTIANAGLTEIQAGQTNGAATEEPEVLKSPVQASTGDDFANAAAEKQWDNAGATAGAADPMEESFEMVPRDPAEVDNPPQPATQTSTTSWADESNAAATPSQNTQSSTPQPVTNGEGWSEAAAGNATAQPDDGFQEVEGRRGGRGGRGEHRGRGRGHGRGGRGGEHRGRGGFRGERRGGGDGEHRGGGGRGRGRGGAPRV